MLRDSCDGRKLDESAKPNEYEDIPIPNWPTEVRSTTASMHHDGECRSFHLRLARREKSMSIVAVGIALAKNVFALHVSVWRALKSGRAPGGSAGYLNQVVNHLIDELSARSANGSVRPDDPRDRCVGTVAAKQAIVLRLLPSHCWYIVSVSRSLPYAMEIIIALRRMRRQRIAMPDICCVSYIACESEGWPASWVASKCNHNSGQRSTLAAKRKYQHAVSSNESPNFDLNRYLQRIGYAGPAHADINTVRSLMRHQLRSVPFENLTYKQARWCPWCLKTSGQDIGWAARRLLLQVLN